MRAVSAPGRMGSHWSLAAEVTVNLGSIEINWVPFWSRASTMTRQSGSDVSATLLAQNTMVLALRKSTDSWPVKKPPPLAGLSGSTRT